MVAWMLIWFVLALSIYLLRSVSSLILALPTEMTSTVYITCCPRMLSCDRDKELLLNGLGATSGGRCFLTAGGVMEMERRVKLSKLAGGGGGNMAINC